MIASNNRSAATSPTTTPDRNGWPNKRTPRQAEASRRNGAKSRGPTTLAGKLVARRNALQHGFYSAALPVEDTLQTDRTAFDQVLAALLEDVRPESQAEVIHCESLAVGYLRLRQVQTSIDLCLDPDQDFFAGKREGRVDVDSVRLQLVVADHLLDFYEGESDEPLSRAEVETIAPGFIAEHEAALELVESAKQDLKEEKLDQKKEPPKTAEDKLDAAEQLERAQLFVEKAKAWARDTAPFADAAKRPAELAEVLANPVPTQTDMAGRIRGFRDWARRALKRREDYNNGPLGREKERAHFLRIDPDKLGSLQRLDTHFRRIIERDWTAIERIRAHRSSALAS